MMCSMVDTRLVSLFQIRVYSTALRMVVPVQLYKKKIHQHVQRVIIYLELFETNPLEFYFHHVVKMTNYIIARFWSAARG